MRLLCALGLIVALFSFSECVSASPHAARRGGLNRRLGSATRNLPSYDNPLLASRQVRADVLRNPPTKAKRACPSFLPNGNCACPSGLTYCPAEDECVNLMGSDASNCGACGTSCGTGEVCSAGSCTCDTANGYTFQCPDYCLTTNDVFFDSSNCGGCGITCPSGTSCYNGQCVCPGSVPGEEYCPAEGACVLTYSDPLNCLGCGLVCPSGLTCTRAGCCPSCGTGEVCQSQACVCDTYHGYQSCNGECINTSDYATDAQNCGQCGVNCPSGTICSGGSCTCAPCPYGKVCSPGTLTCVCDTANGFASCSGAAGGCYPIIEYQVDPFNCGGCGIQCPSLMCSNGVCVCSPSCGTGEICQSGLCVCDTANGYVSCGGSCILSTDFQTDVNNCGSCGNACPLANEYCNGGNCYCLPGLSYCSQSNSCLDTSEDSANCGACGKNCGANEYCSAGSCVCVPGSTVCNYACITDGTNCDVTGVIGLAYSSDSSNTIFDFYDGVDYVTTKGTGYYPYWVASLGVSGQPISSTGGLLAGLTTINDFSSMTSTNGATAYILLDDNNSYPQSPPNSPPQSVSGGYFESAVWSVAGNGVPTSAGTGYLISATWTNPDSTSSPLTSWFGGQSGGWKLTAAPSLGGYERINVYFIPN